jgi:hypothetical protein
MYLKLFLPMEEKPPDIFGGCECLAPPSVLPLLFYSSSQLLYAEAAAFTFSMPGFTAKR